ncbi:MAG: hypothetical protein KDC24_11525 [Saprospiraceae bacterium]|nr:hypothetical protein [Saprospiraceae bacterium]
MLKFFPLMGVLFSGTVLLGQGPFESKIEEAFSFLEKREVQINEVAGKFDCPKASALAIGFPELIRYQLVKDLFETTALELLYEDLGSREVDFSIGPFQMKPSFVEELETVILNHPNVFSELQWVAAYDTEDVKNQRAIRLQRLESFEWQLNYLFSFYKVADLSFSDEAFCNEHEKIAFFASAYNLGFKAERNLIRSFISKEIFPYGKKYNGPQVAYAALAVRYFQEQTPRKTEIFCVNR